MGHLTLWTAAVDLTITLRSALHIGTGLGLAQILDDRIVQGRHPLVEGADLPYIPGSSLKGRLRAHVRQLSADLEWDLQQRTESEAHLFGFDDTPGSLVFADAYLADLGLARSLAETGGGLLPAVARSERSFVSLSRNRRVGLSGRLFRIELADAGLAFVTQLRGSLPAESAERDMALLLAAARDLTHLGGHKGRGLGACSIAIGTIVLGDKQPTWSELREVLR